MPEITCYREGVRLPGELLGRQLFLLASAWFVACSVELAPAETGPSNGPESDASTGGVSQGNGGSAGGNGGTATGGAPFGGAAGGGGLGAGGAGGTGAVAGSGGTGNVSGAGGTGNVGGGFQCNVSLPECDRADLLNCVCAGCDYPSCEGVGDYFPDCVCDICWGHPICTIASCNFDSVCNPFDEGCDCPDCAAHFECIGF